MADEDHEGAPRATSEYVEELLRWLARWDTEYAKFVDPKVQILAALEEHKQPAHPRGVERFLEDVNEPARFHAVTALLAQEDAGGAPGARSSSSCDEESVRVRAKIAEGLAAQGWDDPRGAEREAVARALPSRHVLDAARSRRRSAA